MRKGYNKKHLRVVSFRECRNEYISYNNWQRKMHQKLDKRRQSRKRGIINVMNKILRRRKYYEVICPGSTNVLMETKKKYVRDYNNFDSHPQEDTTKKR